MVEWFKAHAWKACEVKASAGSNPVLCAILVAGLGLTRIRPTRGRPVGQTAGLVRDADNFEL